MHSPFLKALPTAEGLSTKQVIELLTTDTDVAPAVPTGKKCDVYVVVDNCRNVRHKKELQNNVFDDDCGVWHNTAARSIRTHYRYAYNSDEQFSIPVCIPSLRRPQCTVIVGVCLSFRNMTEMM